MRPAIPTVALVLGLAGCERDAPPAPAPAPEAVVDGVGAPPASTGSLGAGSALTGSVSGLAGEVTAFTVEETATTIVVELAADVLFAFDSDRLAPTATVQLRKTVDQIARGGVGPISVIGHTDSMGSDSYNDDLSLRRARAVASWLSSEGGVAADRLKTEGRGERDPAAPNAGADGKDAPEGRAMNRRVTVVIPKAA